VICYVFKVTQSSDIVINTPTMQTCNHCQSDRLVWDWANGDVVCTSCGTINQERFIDDKCNYRDYESHECKEPKVINKNLNKVVSDVNTIFYNGMIDDTSKITENIQSMCDNNTTAKVSKADIVASVYACEKGLTAKELCTNMNVKSNKFWKSVKNDTVWENRLLDIIKRLVYGCDEFDTKNHWVIIKSARKIIDRIKSSPELQNLKPDRFAVSLIYVACNCEKLCQNKKKFVKLFGMSLETLLKHEHIIQTILTK
jgi:transcription initiation factor TFIIIB Brf1 subunit/transcription initiation factor TFIIB